MDVLRHSDQKINARLIVMSRNDHHDGMTLFRIRMRCKTRGYNECSGIAKMIKGHDDRLKHTGLSLSFQHAQQQVGRRFWISASRYSQLAENVGSKTALMGTFTDAQRSPSVKNLLRASEVQCADCIPS